MTRCKLLARCHSLPVKKLQYILDRVNSLNKCFTKLAEPTDRLRKLQNRNAHLLSGPKHTKSWSTLRKNNSASYLYIEWKLAWKILVLLCSRMASHILCKHILTTTPPYNYTRSLFHVKFVVIAFTFAVKKAHCFCMVKMSLNQKSRESK